MVSLSQVPLQGETSALITAFLAILAIIIILWLLAASIKIVKEYERVVVLRFLGAKCGCFGRARWCTTFLVPL